MTGGAAIAVLASGGGTNLQALLDAAGPSGAYRVTHVASNRADAGALARARRAGITATVSENWQFAVRGTNLTNELGLTESNSRIFGAAAGNGGVLLARPIEGREINFQAKYLF